MAHPALSQHRRQHSSGVVPSTYTLVPLPVASAALYALPFSQKLCSTTRVAVATTPVTVVDVVLVAVWDMAVSTVRTVVVVVAVAVVLLDTVVAGPVTPRSEQREETFVGARRRRRGTESSGQVVRRPPRRTMMEGRR